MPEIIALIAPQNIMPAFADSLGILGAHEHHVAMMHSSGSNTQIQRFTLQTPVQKIHFQESSRWLLAALSNSGAITPYLYKERILVCALGACNNHQQLASELQLLLSCSLANLIAALLDRALQAGHTFSAALKQLEGKFDGDVGLIAQYTPDAQYFYALNLGVPLFLGLESGLGQICSSSAKLIRLRANPVHEISHGEVVRFGLNAPALCHSNGDSSPLLMSASKTLSVPHHMLAEIQSQPVTLAAQVDKYKAEQVFPKPLLAKLAGIHSVTLLASGSSFHAAMIASYWFETLAGLKTQVELASEYRYRDIHPDSHELVIAISQSGETADTVEALRLAQQKGHPETIALCNAADSTLTTLTDHTLLTNSGAELSVSSTKSFTAQLLLLYQLALTLGKTRKTLSAEQIARAEQEMYNLAKVIHATLDHNKELRRWAGELHSKQNLFVIGRHAMYPVALEGAFKFKEVAYQHATGFAAGELKHGPITLVNDDLPVIACLPWNAHAERMLSNLHEIRANRGEIFVLSDGNLASSDKFNVIHMPSGLHDLAPIVYSVALQLLAYHSAVLRGNTIDSPRNLAKSQITA
ncbi:isomerizing glutamine--fructose-6-phosphate transaminase [Chitinibacter sp. GC72]|uniref:isomerizing glutamine--fructose-6-phosphate transaminase n=1 Tax=Chitinibacter sp. GC72 TaxID=1526917 RepID=UPI0012F8A2FA|nr:isomerizing glutamine--fructose-6-phosphate transaminase [Chitinibacter sp. GC72]